MRASTWEANGANEPAAVRENHERVAKAAGYDPAQLRRARQVHGSEVVRVESVPQAADAIWCAADDGVVVGVLTADCVPVLIADAGGIVTAAVHSGWRGTAANIVGKTVSVLSERARASELVAAIGPCIEVEAFEVGQEVAAQFPGAFVRHQGPKPHVDLVAAVRHQLQEAGVLPDNIERVGGCTHAHPDRYFSYRRDGAGIGQMLAFIGFA